MMMILGTLWELYNTIILKYQALDPRLNHLFWLQSPFRVVYLCIAYYIFVRKVGPMLMANRQPFELKKILLVYNLFQICYNIYLVVLGIKIMTTYPTYKEWTCMTVDKSSDDITEGVATYYYGIIKMVDLLDTVFMVLRKSYRQITFLHVYHHLSMALVCCLLTPYVGGGHFMPFGLANSFVHAVMYTYYFLSAFSPAVKKSLWWKKHITQLQLLQFAFILIHFSIAFFNPSCTFCKDVLLFGIVQNSCMIYMFSKFYYNAYIKPNKTTKIQ